MTLTEQELTQNISIDDLADEVFALAIAVEMAKKHKVLYIVPWLERLRERQKNAINDRKNEPLPFPA